MELVAAIGRVESDHGRYGGNTLTQDGVSKPGIYGIELNGKNGTQAVHDTDGGQLDHDPVYDRAVGAMQFIPSTWQVVKVDADGDGNRNPQDIDDASLATAVYLCSGSDNLGARKGQEAAVYRYNHSQSYVNLVLRIMEAYSSGDYTALPSGTYGGSSFSSSGYSSAIDHSYKKAKQRKQRTKAKARAATAPTRAARAPSSSSGSNSGGGTADGAGGSGRRAAAASWRQLRRRHPDATTATGVPRPSTARDRQSVARPSRRSAPCRPRPRSRRPSRRPSRTPPPALTRARPEAQCMGEWISVSDPTDSPSCIADLLIG